ncbi:MAG: PEP-CTERM sorting domain-containing protein [Aquabacterium sp.]
MFNRSLLCLAIATALASPAMAATISVNTDRASFEASLGGPVTVEDFTDTHHFPIHTGVLNSATNLPGIGITPGTIKAGVTYSVQLPMPEYGFNIDAGAQFVGGFLDTVQGNGPLTVTFDSAVSGFGFDTNAFSPNVHVVVHFADGSSDTFDGMALDMSMHFFGFTGNGSLITHAEIGSPLNGSTYFGLDNFTFVAGAVPEPGTYALMALGLVGVGAVARRRKA